MFNLANKIKVSKEWAILAQGNSNDKGKLGELIGVGIAIKEGRTTVLRTKHEQSRGDFTTTKNGNTYNMECKFGSTFKGKDSLLIDYAYYQDQDKTRKYYQRGANNNLGWGNTTRADYLLVYCHASKKAYLIKEFPLLWATVTRWYYEGHKERSFYNGSSCFYSDNKWTFGLGIWLEEIPCDKFKVTVYDVEFI